MTLVLVFLPDALLPDKKPLLYFPGHAARLSGGRSVYPPNDVGKLSVLMLQGSYFLLNNGPLKLLSRINIVNHG